MNKIKIVFGLVVLLSLSAAAYSYLKFEKQTSTNIFEAEKPEKRSISQTISALGRLDIEGLVKVGSLASGTVKKIYVEENQYVQEGELLAEIETGLGDTEIKGAQAIYEKALAEKNFQEAEHTRHRELFEKKFIGEAKYQEYQRAYLISLADLKSAEAILEQKNLDYQNRKIRAPSSGTIIAIEIVKGQLISTSLEASTLFRIAPDITKMEADLMIEERDIGQIKKGQAVRMVVDTYPNKIFESTIASISFSPKEKESEKKDKNVHSYHARAYIDNSHLLLRPGMSVTSDIHVNAVQDAFSISSRAFLIKEENLQLAAKSLGYKVKPISKLDKQSLLFKYPDNNIQFVWKIAQNIFEEIPLEVGISDSIYFQIISEDSPLLVVNVIELDSMQELYDELSNRGL